MANQQHLDPPLEVNVPGYGTLRFSTLANASEWAAKERAAFTFANEVRDVWYREGKALYRDVYGQVEEVVAKFPQMMEESAIPGAVAEVRDKIERITSYGIENSRTVVGQKIIEIKDSNPTLAAALMMLRSDAPMQLKRAGDFRPLIRAQELVRQLEMGEAGAVELQAKAFDEIIADYSLAFAENNERMEGFVREADEYSEKLTKLFEDQSSQHDQLSTLHRDEMAEIRKEFEEAKTALQTSYSEELKLRSVSSYWREKAKEHRNALRKWAAAFFIVAVSGAGGLFLYGQEVVRTTIANSGSFQIGNLVVVTIPALIFFWIMRMLSRFVLNNLRRYDDANERRLIVNTYLALLAKASSGVTEEERVLLLNAIFRPGPGETKDEGEATLLTELVRSQRGSPAG